jgi:hypothetical protein
MSILIRNTKIGVPKKETRHGNTTNRLGNAARYFTSTQTDE